MKIYTKVVFDMDSMDVIESEHFNYDGLVAECKGGTTTQYVQSPEAREALEAVMPALRRIGTTGG